MFQLVLWWAPLLVAGFFALVIGAMLLHMLSDALDRALSTARWWQILLFALSLCGGAWVVADMVHSLKAAGAFLPQ
jgi:uncharacterized membrane protein YvlD (DUF360 family)